jgi:hypothetical protein
VKQDLGVLILLQVRESLGQRRIQLDAFVTTRAAELLEDGKPAARRHLATARIADERIEIGKARQHGDETRVIRAGRFTLCFELRLQVRDGQPDVAVALVALRQLGPHGGHGYRRVGSCLG